jgi:hypothetical protein
MYLMPKGFNTLMNSDGDAPDLVILGTVKDLKIMDRGGAIYKLPIRSFEATP